MKTEQIKQHFIEARDILDLFILDDSNFEKIAIAGRMITEAMHRGNKVISCGNGGSMSDAMHFAEELTGRFKNDRQALPAVSISDPAHITCVGNDYGFSNIFSRYIEGLGSEGDVLLAISTSGNSGNIIEAAHTAARKGLKVIALTGCDGGKLKAYCDVEIRAPHSDYSDRTQELHIKVIHTLIDYIEQNI